MTLTFDLDRKIAYNFKTTGQILMQFYGIKRIRMDIYDLDLWPQDVFFIKFELARMVSAPLGVHTV